MEDILSQLLLSTEQQQWGCEAPLEQFSPNSDSGYYSSCSISDPGYNGASLSSDSGYSSVCQKLDPVYYNACLSSDLSYNSACGSVSPTSSVDSGYLSSPPLQWGAADRSPLPAPVPTATMTTLVQPRPGRPGRKSRSKQPGRKRETASEREKLRMRDLAKALSHLRTFLPPSVAPVGQTLTKIETLRLAARYIARLSAQLGEDRTQGGLPDSSSPLPSAQDHLRTSFQPPMHAESPSAAPLGFPQPSEHLNPLPSYQNPFTDVSSECFWIPEISHTLYGK